jgi:soluble lytic murein transglycosylase-like protein
MLSTVRVNPFKGLVFVVLAIAGSNSVAGDFNYSIYRLNPKLSPPLRITSRLAAEIPAVDANSLSEVARVDPSVAQWLAARPFAKLIEDAAHDSSLEPALVHAVISVESGYNASARSPKGALGLMQVMPATAMRYGVNNAARSPAANLRAGTRYLKALMGMFDQRLDLVLAAYNAGEGAVQRYGQRIPPYRETQQYVPAVLALYREWRGPTPLAAAAPDILSVAPHRVRIEYMPGTLLEINSQHVTNSR